MVDFLFCLFSFYCLFLWGGCHCWFWFFGLGWVFFPQDFFTHPHGCLCVHMCVYTHKDFHVIICVVRPTFQRCVSHYSHLIELKWLHKGKWDPDSSCLVHIFSGNFESGKWKRKPRESWCRTYVLWKDRKYMWEGHIHIQQIVT